MAKKICGIGIVGIGSISGIYLENITKIYKELKIVAVCDLVKERAIKASQDYSIEKVYDTMEELFADKEIDIVLNLTRPYEHFAVTLAALEAGKHVYSEKPLGATLEEGETLVKRAKELNLLIGGAPDTFMGAGIQTCRKLIDSGIIGDLVGGAAYMLCRGHESWHPDPEFYYKFGGGPMMDMGPYYLTAMVNLMGGVKNVNGMVRKSFEKRLITSKEHSGEIISVDVPTHITGLLEFDNGAIGTITTSFDVQKGEVPFIEIYGSEGTLSVPDPNYFGAGIKLYRKEKGEFLEMPLMFDYDFNSRGLGLADMGKAIQEGREVRANSTQTLHILEIMTAINKSSEQGKRIEIKNKFAKANPMEHGGVIGIL